MILVESLIIAPNNNGVYNLRKPNPAGIGNKFYDDVIRSLNFSSKAAQLKSDLERLEDPSFFQNRNQDRQSFSSFLGEIKSQLKQTQKSLSVLNIFEAQITIQKSSENSVRLEI